MTIAYDVSIRNASMDAITTRAGASALLRVYDSTGAGRPATGGAITTQVLLAELTCNATFAPSASGGVLTLNAITQDSSANGTGTATWGRIVKSDGTTFVCDFDAGADVVTTTTGTSGQDTVTVGSATGLVVGQYVTGTGIGTGARIDFISGTTVHLTVPNSGAVSGNGTFFYDLRLTPALITITQPVQVTSFVMTASNA
jgi:hypothetical protein